MYSADANVTFEALHFNQAPKSHFQSWYMMTSTLTSQSFLLMFSQMLNATFLSAIEISTKVFFKKTHKNRKQRDIGEIET